MQGLYESYGGTEVGRSSVGSWELGDEKRELSTKRIPWVDSSVHLPPLQILEGHFVISVPTKNVQYHT